MKYRIYDASLCQSNRWYFCGNEEWRNFENSWFFHRGF